MEEHLGLLRELGAPATAAALGVAMHLARLAGVAQLRPGQRDAALRLLIFLTVLEVSLLIFASTLAVNLAALSMLNHPLLADSEPRRNCCLCSHASS